MDQGKEEADRAKVAGMERGRGSRTNGMGICYWTSNGGCWNREWEEDNEIT